MDKSHDDKEIRCRRLGNPVTFRFCRCEASAATPDSDPKPCRLLLDCWWESFDVQAYLRQNYPKETWQDIEAAAPPPNRTASIVDMIREAQVRLSEKEHGKQSAETRDDKTKP